MHADYPQPQVFVLLYPREITGKLTSCHLHMPFIEKLELLVRWWKYMGGVLLGVICQMDHLTRQGLLASFA